MIIVTAYFQLVNLFILSLSFSILPDLQNKQLAPKILASVGEKIIEEEQFVERYSDYLFATGIRDNLAAREAILNNIINETLLYYYDENAEVFSNEEYKKEIAWAEKQSVLAYLKDQEVYAKIKVNESEIRQAFVRVNESIAASHLYAPTLEEAEYLYNLVKAGVDWDNLAAQVFTDSTLRNNGGYLGYFTWGDMDPAFEDAAYSLQIGEISKPVKTAHGYSIIKVNDRNYHPLLTESEFQNKKSKLERIIRIKKKPEAEKKYLAQIFDEAKYLLNEKSFNNLTSFFGFADIGKKENSYQPDPNETCVVYGNKKFSEQFIIEQLLQIPNYHFTKIVSRESLKQAIKGVIIQNLLYNEAVKKGYSKNNLVLDTADKIKMQIFLKYKMKQIFSQINVTDSLLNQYYKENRDLFKLPDEISIQEIIVGNKLLADEILLKLKQGRDFGALAQEYSIREFSKKNGGVIDYSPITKFGFMKSELWQAEIGETIGPKELKGAYGIFKILGKRSGIQKKFDEINKSDILLAYKNTYEIKLRDEYLKELRKKVPISINSLVLKSINLLDMTSN